MHEYSLVQALLDRVELEAAAHHATLVTRIEVRIGDLAGVDRELFELAFIAFREHTPAAGAALAIVPVAARWACPRCGTAPPPGAVLRCPHCALPAALVAGGEIVLDRVEMEVR